MQTITYKPLITYPGFHLNLPSISIKGGGNIKFPVSSMKKLFKKSFIYHFITLLKANTE